MKRILMLLLFLLSITGSANAVTISYDYIIGTDGTLTTPYEWAMVETFDNSTLLWDWEGNGTIVSGSLSGKYAAPGGTDTTNYLAVPNPVSSGSITADLGFTCNYFGLYWGSVDAYNFVSFFNDDDLVASYSGSQVTLPSPANGNQTSPGTNLYVNFLDLPEYDSFTLTSIGYAFESDNIAVGTAPVPEPATIFLLGSGLIGLVGFRRRKTA